MKILHLADLHARPHWLDWVSAHAGEFDLICLAGDLLDLLAVEGPRTPVSSKPSDMVRLLRPDPRPALLRQTQMVSAWLESLPTPTVVCSGNHDWWPPAKDRADESSAAGWLRTLSGKGNVVAVDGGSAEFGGLRIFSLGWDQPSEWPDGTDVVVCHGPPPSTPVAGTDPGLGQGPDQADLWQELWARPPQFFLCGHIHAPRRNWYWFPPGERQTLLLNPGCDFSAAQPNHWIIDTDLGTAHLHGHAQAEVEFMPPDTVLRFRRVKAAARRIFSTDLAAEAWIRTRAPALNGRRPADLLDSEDGERTVMQLIAGIAFGNVL